MEKIHAQQKYLEVLRTLNSVRRATYRKMTQYLDTNLQKLFSKLSIDSMANAHELDEMMIKSANSFTRHHSFEPLSLLQSLKTGAADIFDLCREAEWRLLRYYDELIGNPQTTDEVRALLIPQRNKVLSGYEHLNMLSNNPW